MDKQAALTTGNFTIQAQMANGKTITVSGYVYSNQGIGEINKQVDLLHDVFDRQRTRSEIPELEAKMEQRFRALSDMRDAMTELSGKEKTTPAERKMVAQMAINIDKINADIEKGKAAIIVAKESLK